jgi:hypothetical protein
MKRVSARVKRMGTRDEDVFACPFGPNFTIKHSMDKYVAGAMKEDDNEEGDDGEDREEGKDGLDDEDDGDGEDGEGDYSWGAQQGRIDTMEGREMT